jgi:dTDP-glucose pyrophosphorylase
LLDEAPFLVTWADVIVDPGPYRRVSDAAAGHDAALAVNHVADLSAGGAVTFAEGLVTGVTEKPGPGVGWNLTGILALDPLVWPYIDGLEQSVRGEFELPEAIDAWVGDGGLIAAAPVDGKVFEIGTPDGLATASSYFSGETSRSR